MENKMDCRKNIVLGSASPRRRELLQQIGMEFTIVTSDCEEKITKIVPSEVVQELSLMKAKDVFSVEWEGPVPVLPWYRNPFWFSK